MTRTHIPEGQQAVCPYFLIQHGARFIDFAKKVFGAEEKAVHKNPEGGIMHAELSIDGSIIMFGESNETWPSETGGLFVYVRNTDEVYKKALAAGAESRQVPDNKDYGRAAGVRDPFGITWWITQI